VLLSEDLCFAVLAWMDMADVAGAASTARVWRDVARSHRAEWRRWRTLSYVGHHSDAAGVDQLLTAALCRPARLPAPLRLIAPPPEPPILIDGLGEFTWRVNHLMGWAVEGSYLWVINPELSVLLKVRLADGEVVSRSACGFSDHELRYPQGLALMGGEVFVCDLLGHCVAVYSAHDLSFRRIIGKREKGSIGVQSPYGIAAFERELFVADCSASRVLCFHADGAFVRFVGGALQHPRGVAIVPAPVSRPHRARVCVACQARAVPH